MRLRFADLLDASLEGANMSPMQLGYTVITGKGDAFTHPPEPCEVATDLIVDCVW